MRLRLTGALVAALIVVCGGAGAISIGMTDEEYAAALSADAAEASAMPVKILGKVETVSGDIDEGCVPFDGMENRSSDLCAQWKAADAAKRSAQWTALSVVVSLIAAAVGGVTLYFLFETYEETRKTAYQATLASMLTHSPKFHFGEVVLPLRVGQTLSGKMLSMNVGQVATLIENMTLGVYIGAKALPQENPINTFKQAETDEKGADIQWWHYEGPVLDQATYNEIITGNKTLYVIGRAVYETAGIPNRRKRHAKFCFKFAPDKQRFVTVDDPDYVHGG